MANQKGIAPFALVLAGFTLVVGIWFVYTNYYTQPQMPSVEINPQKTAPIDRADGNQAPQAQNVTQSNEQIDTSTWQTYKNQTCGYEIKYPVDYEVKTAEESASFISPATRECVADAASRKQPTYACSQLAMDATISCQSKKELLGNSSLRDYLNNKAVKPESTPKDVALGENIGKEIEDYGMAGSYRNIYLENGGKIINITIGNEFNDSTRMDIFDQMISTIKLNTPASFSDDAGSAKIINIPSDIITSKEKLEKFLTDYNCGVSCCGNSTKLETKKILPGGPDFYIANCGNGGTCTMGEVVEVYRIAESTSRAIVVFRGAKNGWGGGITMPKTYSSSEYNFIDSDNNGTFDKIAETITNMVCDKTKNNGDCCWPENCCTKTGTSFRYYKWDIIKEVFVETK